LMCLDKSVLFFMAFNTNRNNVQPMLRCIAKIMVVVFCGYLITSCASIGMNRKQSAVLDGNLHGRYSLSFFWAFYLIVLKHPDIICV